MLLTVNLKAEYDTEDDTLYIVIKGKKTLSGLMPVTPNIIAEVAGDEIVGFQILKVSKKLLLPDIKNEKE